MAASIIADAWTLVRKLDEVRVIGLRLPLVTSGAVVDMSQSPDLAAEVALVTGGSRNIGLAIARTLRAAGARVCIWGASDSVALAAALGTIDGGADDRCGMLVRVDDESAVLHGFDEIGARLGPVSILVNNSRDTPRGTPGDDDARRLDSGPRRDADRRVPDVAGAVPPFAEGPERRHRQHRRSQRPPSEEGPRPCDHGQGGPDRPDARTGRGGPGPGPGQLRRPGRDRHRCRPDGRRPPYLDDAGHAAGSPDAVARAVLALADPGEPYVTGQTLHVSGGRFMP